MPAPQAPANSTQLSAILQHIHTEAQALFGQGKVADYIVPDRKPATPSNGAGFHGFHRSEDFPKILL